MKHDSIQARRTWAALGLAGLSLLMWVPLLLWAQPEQQNRRAFERAIEKKDYQAAAAALNRPLEEFPPRWQPPLLPKDPELIYTRQVVEVLVALHEQGGPKWAIDLYERRLLEHLALPWGWSSDDLDVFRDGLPRIPLGAALLAEGREDPEAGKEENWEEKARRATLREVLRWQATRPQKAKNSK